LTGFPVLTEANAPPQIPGTPTKNAATNKPRFILKDVRLFLNTVSRGMDMMKRAGINGNVHQIETEDDVILTITIPKANR